MRLPNTILRIFFFLSTLPTLTVRAQPSGKDSLISDSAYTIALRQYHAFVAPETGLYRGPQYADYDYLIQKGEPFFGPDSIRTGTIWYDGIFYEHIPMLYDLVKGLVVIQDPLKSIRFR